MKPRFWRSFWGAVWICILIGSLVMAQNVKISVFGFYWFCKKKKLVLLKQSNPSIFQFQSQIFDHNSHYFQSFSTIYRLYSFHIELFECIFITFSLMKLVKLSNYDSKWFFTIAIHLKGWVHMVNQNGLNHCIKAHTLDRPEEHHHFPRRYLFAALRWVFQHDDINNYRI